MLDFLRIALCYALAPRNRAVQKPQDRALSRKMTSGYDLARSRRGARPQFAAKKTIATSLSPMEEALLIALRKEQGLSLDAIVPVMKRCLRREIARSSVHRCLQRHSLSARTLPARQKHQRFTAEQPFGFIHLDVKHLPRLDGKPAYAFVAIDRAPAMSIRKSSPTTAPPQLKLSCSASCRIFPARCIPS